MKGKLNLNLAYLTSNQWSDSNGSHYKGETDRPTETFTILNLNLLILLSLSLLKVNLTWTQLILPPISDPMVTAATTKARRIEHQRHFWS